MNNNGASGFKLRFDSMYPTDVLKPPDFTRVKKLRQKMLDANPPSTPEAERTMWKGRDESRLFYVTDISHLEEYDPQRYFYILVREPLVFFFSLPFLQR